MKNIEKSYRYNVIIFILEVIAIIWMVSGIIVLPSSGNLLSSGFEMFKYFTVDSNIVMALVALLFVINDRQIINGKKKEISKKLYVLKLISTVGVAYTMLVSIVFLAPNEGIIILFDNAILLLHLVCPILSIITFIFYEKSNDINIKFNLLSLIPFLFYVIYYCINIYYHMDNLVMYDWYGMYLLEEYSFYIVPIIILITYYLLSLLLWYLNKK